TPWTALALRPAGFGELALLPRTDRPKCDQAFIAIQVGFIFASIESAVDLGQAATFDVCGCLPRNRQPFGRIGHWATRHAEPTARGAAVGGQCELCLLPVG